MDKAKLVVMDTETYPNYFLVKFKRVSDGKRIGFEMFEDSELNVPSISNMMSKYTHITFNGIKYDQLMLEGALAGYTNIMLYELSTTIIGERMVDFKVRAKFGFRKFHMQQIDIMEPAPLTGSLKVYAGRRHVKHMEDLPYPFDTVLTREQANHVNRYCDKDLHNTHDLFDGLQTQLELREGMSDDYSINLMSKSDPQIAEAVLKHELTIINGKKPKKPTSASRSFLYEAPANLVFKTDVMKQVLNLYTTTPFIKNSKSGKLEKTKDFGESHGFKNAKITIGEGTYKLGLGGIHSCEKSVCYNNTRRKILAIDVTSYYPMIILNNEFFPKHLGKGFLVVLRSLLTRRLAAKSGAKDMSKTPKERIDLEKISASLKIVINGMFGKTSEQHSILYDPKVMMQATITGQLSLLMLVERLELAGVNVISANTDSVTIHPDTDAHELDARHIVSDWERDTGFTMEYDEYDGLYAKDLNNYLAIYNGESTGKGCYGNMGLSKNPTNQICTDAIIKYLADAIPVDETIRASRDIRNFVNIRKVNSGALWEGELIGKVIRWYYSNSPADDYIYYRPKQELLDNPIHVINKKGIAQYNKDGTPKYKGLNPKVYNDENVYVGNKVPKSNGAVPMMDMPDDFPTDVDFGWYIAEAKGMLKNMGVTHI